MWGGAPICLILSTRRLPFQLHSFIPVNLLVTSLVSRTSPQAFLAASLNHISSCPTTSLPTLDHQWVTATLDRDRFWIRTIALKFKIVILRQFSTLEVFFESLRHKIASNYPSTSVTSVTTSPSTSLYTFLPEFTRALSSPPWGNPSGGHFCKSNWVTERNNHNCIHYPFLFLAANCMQLGNLCLSL